MTVTNSSNLAYFEHTSMQGLYAVMEEWQQASGQRLLSVSIQPDGGKYCAIALTNPVEVVITSVDGHHHAAVNRFGYLAVDTER
ncbi:hypothetical protein [Nocardia sp. NBC_00511]|uniref:hypothetical protein n=1 Tax=Nocardia sp. NBC_00511 TaxID=2903591 RepID=UPI0030E251E2